jgi:hypothetical protein
MEVIMCNYRSHITENKAAEADRQKDLAAKREEVMYTLLRQAKAPQNTATDRPLVKEVAPVK